MKQLRYVDYDCLKCSASCTRFVYFDTDAGVPIDPEICGAWYGVISGEGINYKTGESVEFSEDLTCKEVLVPREMSGVGYVKTIVKGNSDFNERERARLEKRQDDHWRRKGLDEAVDRDRTFSKKHGVAPGFK